MSKTQAKANGKAKQEKMAKALRRKPQTEAPFSKP